MISGTHDEPTSRLHRIATKAAYSRIARDKLVAARSKLDSINAALRQATATGRLQDSAQLAGACESMEARFAEVEVRLAQLQKSGDDDWEARRELLDDAWENLAHAIQRLVARFDDDTREN